jgi:hypothetical protein
LNVPDLTPDEPLSPELVLVLPPELRARALASLGDPVWPTPRQRPVETPAQPPLRRAPAPAPSPLAQTRVRRPPIAEPPPLTGASFARSLGALVGARLVQLGLIFVIVTIITLALTLVAQAIR